jgi:hypothetical protein
MTTQAIAFVDKNLAMTAPLAIPEMPKPATPYVWHTDPDTGLFVPMEFTKASGGVPSQGFLIGGQRWNLLNHTLGTYQINAMIVLAEPMAYASADGMMTGRYYAKYEPLGHGVVEGMESNGYIVDLGDDYPAAESVYVLLFPIGMDQSVGTTGALSLMIDPTPSPNGSAITITIAGAVPGEDVMVNWATRPDGQAPLSLTFTADAEGKVVNMDVVGSQSAMVGDYSGTLSSTSGLVGTFSYTLG